MTCVGATLDLCAVIAEQRVAPLGSSAPNTTPRARHTSSSFALFPIKSAHTTLQLCYLIGALFFMCYSHPLAHRDAKSSGCPISHLSSSGQSSALALSSRIPSVLRGCRERRSAGGTGQNRQCAARSGKVVIWGSHLIFDLGKHGSGQMFFLHKMRPFIVPPPTSLRPAISSDPRYSGPVHDHT